MKVIEFNGLPGCGKTTLCDEFIRQSPEKRISYINSVENEIKSIPFFTRVAFFPYMGCFLVLCMFLTTPLLPLKEMRIYQNTLKFVINYRYAHFLDKYDFLLEDHGLIQCIVSFFYRREEYYKPFHSRLVQRLYKHIKPTAVVYCKISAETAAKRMTKRNRNGGRIDRIKDVSEKLDALKKQKAFFEHIISEVDMAFVGKFVNLDMEEDAQVIYKNCISSGIC